MTKDSDIFMTAVNPKGKMVIQVPCVDVYPASAFKEADQSVVFSAISLMDSIWKSGSKGVITITFGSYGCPGCSPDAAWSHIGNNSTTQMPSMNLGFMDPPYEPFELDGVTYEVPAEAMRNYCGPSGKDSCEANWQAGATVIHEFCHALGMLHEHQNNLENSNEIKLNEDAVIQYYERIGMGKEGAVTNVLERYSCTEDNECKYDGTKYDKESIMLYALPDDWIDGKNPTYPNFKLSHNDSSWLKEVYPMDIENFPEITIKFVDPNPEPWKVAWTKKMVKETFEPLIGVKWIFEDNLKKGSTKTTSEATRAPTAVRKAEAGGSPEPSDAKVWSPGEIIGIVVISLIALGLFGVLGVWILKTVKSRK